MKLTKENVLIAVKSLIKGYKEGTIVHHLNACPLCLIYEHESSLYCDNCLNNVFKDKIRSNRSCVNRGNLYSQLNYLQHENNLVIGNFWQDVYEIVKDLKEEELLLMSAVTKVKILIVAEKYRLPSDV